MIIGLVGSMFNIINKKVLSYRAIYRGTVSLMLIDTLFVILITSMIKIFLPLLLYECQPHKSSYQCSSNEISDFYLNSNLDGVNFLKYNCKEYNWWIRFVCPEGLTTSSGTLFFSTNYP